MTENRRIRPGSLLLLLLVVCVFILARSMNSSGTVAYSDMCRYFREEKVQSFTITGDVLKAKLQDGTLAACTIGSVESFYSDMDGLIQQQVQSGTVQQQDFIHATNWVTTLLPYVMGILGFLLIVPGLAVFLAIILYPFVDAVITSFTDRSLIYPDYKFVAFANYAKVFKDPYFGKTLITTLLFVLGSTVLPYTLGMIWAIDLNQGFKGAEFLRGVTLVNWIIPGTAIGFLWSWIFNGQYGILNSILKALGILETGIPWLGQTNTALLCVIIARTWQMLPWYMAFLLGGLQSVSLDQIEAAHIDGANNWTTFWHIILPGMKQTAVLVFILGLIGNLQHFDLPWTMAQGGPARATTTLSIEVYTTAFKNWNMGKAATVGTIWAILLAIFSIVYLRQQNKQDG